LFNTLEEYSSGLTSAVYNVDFWQTAFSTPLLTLSKPFVIGDNVVILHPTEQIIEDEQNIVRRENAYPSQMSNFTGENIRSYFFE